MYTIAINAYTTCQQPTTHERKLNPYPDPLKHVLVEVGTGLWRAGYGLVTVYPRVTCDNH